jgi:hypothetical protein
MVDTSGFVRYCLVLRDQVVSKEHRLKAQRPVATPMLAHPCALFFENYTVKQKGKSV